MAVYRFERLVDDSHLIELPPEVPSGWVEISVLPLANPSAPSDRYFTMLGKLLSTPAENPMGPDEILAEIRHERDSWE